jgi:hypothetical protein
MPAKHLIATLALGLPTAALSEAPDWTATANFTPPEGAAPGAAFNGTLQFATTEMAVETVPPDAMIRNPWDWWGIFDFLAATDPEGAVPLMELDAQLFPGLAISFFTTDAGDLVPVERGLIRLPVAGRTASFWEIIAGPGRTWMETEGDKAGWSQASFPFSLVQSQEGEAWIGLATFHYKDGEVTPVQVQVSSVSAGGFIFWDADFDVNGWAEVPVTYTAGTVADEAALETAFAAERADLLPVRPVADLGLTLPALDPVQTLAMGVLKDGTLYMDPVQTPFGPYPYPQDMRVGVWSVTKSLIPGMAALRLAEKYGTEFLDTPVVSYFKEGEEFSYVDDLARDRWAGVTIRHALNMMTGMGATGYDPNWAMESTNTYQWSYSYDLPDQIRFYFNVGPNPDVTGPGQQMAYIDQDMWIATLAMERFLQSKEGPDATILNMLETEVYDAIGAHHFAAGTGYTPTGETGFPFAAWGALPTVDILARAGRLIANRGAADDGTQILSRELVDGLFASGDYGLAFWRQATPDAAVWVPQMSGAGGNEVLALPDGTSVVILSRDNYNWGPTDEQVSAFIPPLLQ